MDSPAASPWRPRTGCARPAGRILVLALLTLAVVTAEAGGLRCDACKQPITATYRIFDHKNLHESCYLKYYALRCAYCNREITGPYMAYEGNNLHRECYLKRFARYCSICERPIVGEYIHNTWGDAVCAVHVGEFPACEFCGRLRADKLTGRGTRYRDGREICGVCYATAVRRAEDARPLLDSVKSILRRYGIATGLPFEFHLVDRGQMASLTPATGRSSWGYTELKRRGGLFRWLQSEKIDMYILDGMPRVVFMRVAAHELMHVWLFEHASLEMDHMLVEGSCEYAAYLALSEMADPLARFDLDNQKSNEDLAYGAGFRSVSGYVSKVGLENWLGYLRSNLDPPW